MNWLDLRLLYFLVSVVLLVGCAKRPPPQPPPAPSRSDDSRDTGPSGVEVAVPAPQVILRIEPPVISFGESALLTWESQHADRVTIEPTIGVVDPSGTIKFFPDQTTTYTVAAEGRGGLVRESVTVEVRRRPGGENDISEEDIDRFSTEERFEMFVKPVYFSFDSWELSDEALLTLEGNLRWLSQPENRNLFFVLEGHADERGSEEYNLALGDKRAMVVRDYLVREGLDPDRVTTVSMGEESPFDRRQAEEAYALNRRTQFVLLKDGR